MICCVGFKTLSPSLFPAKYSNVYSITLRLRYSYRYCCLCFLVTDSKMIEKLTTDAADGASATE